MLPGLFQDTLLYTLTIPFIILWFYIYGIFTISLIKKTFSSQSIIFFEKFSDSQKFILTIFAGLATTLTLLQNISWFLPLKYPSYVLLAFFILLLFIFIYKKRDITLREVITKSKAVLFLTLVVILGGLFQLLAIKGLEVQSITNNDAFYYIPISIFARDHAIPIFKYDENVIAEKSINSVPNLNTPFMRIGNITLDSLFSNISRIPQHKYFFISKILALLLVCYSSFLLISLFLKNKYLLTSILSILTLLSPLFVRTFLDDFVAFFYGLTFLNVTLFLFSKLLLSGKTKVNDLFILALVVSGLLSLYSDLIILLVLIGVFFLIFNISETIKYFACTLSRIGLIIVISLLFNINASIRAIEFTLLQFQISSITKGLNHSIWYYLNLSSGIKEFYGSTPQYSPIVLSLIYLAFIFLLINIFIYFLKFRKYSKVKLMISISLGSLFLAFYLYKLKEYEYGLIRALAIAGYYLTLILLLNAAFLFNYFKNYQAQINSSFNYKKAGMSLLILFSILIILGVYTVNNAILFKHMLNSPIKTTRAQDNFFLAMRSVPNITRVKIVGTEFANQIINYEHVTVFSLEYLAHVPSTHEMHFYSYYRNNQASDKYINSNFSHILSSYPLGNLFKSGPILASEDKRLYLYKKEENTVIPRGNNWYTGETAENGKYTYWTLSNPSFEAYLTANSDKKLKFDIASYGKARSTSFLLNNQLIKTITISPNIQSIEIDLKGTTGLSYVSLFTKDECTVPGNGDTRKFCFQISNIEVIDK